MSTRSVGSATEAVATQTGNTPNVPRARIRAAPDIGRHFSFYSVVSFSNSGDILQSMTQLRIIEITDDKPIKKWGVLLMGARKAEAIESIKREEVTQETVFYFELAGKKYLVFYMEGAMKPADMEMPINQEHRTIMRSIRTPNFAEGTILYDLRA
jgi:hypothetical protein